MTFSDVQSTTRGTRRSLGDSMNDRDLGWLEGIIDGEGSLYMYKNHRGKTKRGFSYVPELKIGMTSGAAVHRVASLVGTGYYGITSQKPTMLQNGKTPVSLKKIHRFVLGGDGLRKFLPLIRLTTKEEHRQLLLEASRLLTEHRSGHTPNDERLEEIYQSLKQLNG